ncbi:MAG: hypothetical protein Ct9H90mP6_08550 [Gammaproteobacteria bacterium]|nr:MAG: hypothetical protein Ct9H90mP6_08550 [Gammaproteobacteria bacterium]
MLDIYYETEEDTYYTIIEEGNLSKEFIFFYYIISGAQAGGQVVEIWETVLY